MLTGADTTIGHPMTIEEYLRELVELRQQSESTAELSLREPLIRFVRAEAARAGRGALLVAQEANAGQAGQPTSSSRTARA